MNVIHAIIEGMIRNIGGGLGVRLRSAYYRNKFASCGKELRIDVGVIIEGAKFIHLGDQIWIDKNCILMAGEVQLPDSNQKVFPNNLYSKNEGELHIGSQSHLAPNTIIQAYGGVEIGSNFTASADCKIYSLSNDPKKCKLGTYGSQDIHYVKSNIVIGKNVWLGLNTIVLGGTIEDDVFVGPNSVVIQSLPSKAFAQGNPATKIKDRFQ
ncbi:MAG: hypothetical protein R2799_11685 [Crocinitomicaceae bacterium]